MTPRAIQLFHAFAQGFVQTRLEILVLIVLAPVVALIVSAYLVIQKRAARRRLALYSGRLMEERINELGLEEEERQLVHRLASCLDRGEPGHVLLFNRRVFDACARKLLQAGDGSETQLNALRLKLGLRLTGPEETPASSTELPEGSPVVLQGAGAAPCRGSLVGQGPAAMIVTVDPGIRWLTTGASLTVFFYNPAGVFSFQTRVMQREPDAVHLQHSWSITRHQRRRFYRRKEHLPAVIRTASPGAVPQESVVVDLGAGGAIVETSPGEVRVGDLLLVSLPQSIVSAPVEARVLRVSRRGKLIGVEFVSLSEPDRNRVMRFVLRQEEPLEVPAARR
jgi:hypothetical protein